MENTKKLNTITLRAEYSRRYPDPLNKALEGDPLNIDHHILLVRAIDMPSGISLAPNPREQRIDIGIYKEIKESLENAADLSFHLKNKGITILAHRVEYSDDKKVVTIYYDEECEGIVDGGHTYQIILKAQSEGTCPEGQYVKLEIITGVPIEMGVEITRGLNTAVQVNEASLLNLEGEFEWVKEVLADTPYADRIAYKQNEEGDYDIRDILALMTLFNINKIRYPEHPKMAYVSKAECLKLYKKDPASFKMLSPILKDILYLHDYVHIHSGDRYNEVKGGKARKMVGVFATKKRGTYSFIFMGREAKYKLHAGALYPMLGSMRFLVEQKPGENHYSWKLDSFEEVKAFFDEVAPELVDATYKTSVIYGRKPNPIGKDDNHWDNLYKTVALHYMTKYQSRQLSPGK